jgi:hypothetical protein
MTKHVEILDRAGTVEEIALWRGVPVNTAQSWRQRKRIPASHWLAFVEAGHATFAELAQPHSGEAA